MFLFLKIDTVVLYLHLLAFFPGQTHLPKKILQHIHAFISQTFLLPLLGCYLVPSLYYFSSSPMLFLLLCWFPMLYRLIPFPTTNLGFSSFNNCSKYFSHLFQTSCIWMRSGTGHLFQGWPHSKFKSGELGGGQAPWTRNFEIDPTQDLNDFCVGRGCVLLKLYPFTWHRKMHSDYFSVNLFK